MSENPRAKNTRSSEFRYVYANGMGVQFGGSDVTLVFGIKENPASPDDKIMEEVAVIMTHVTAKHFALSLAKMITHVEQANGKVIPVENENLDKLERFLNEITKSTKAINPSPTS